MIGLNFSLATSKYSTGNSIKSKHFLNFLVLHVTLVKTSTRRNERNNPTNSSETLKNFQNNIDHCFTWTILSNALKNATTWKNLEASYIALWKPDLNEQRDCERLVLIGDGVI